MSAAPNAVGKWGRPRSLQRAGAADMLCGDLRRLKSDRPQGPGGFPC